MPASYQLLARYTKRVESMGFDDVNGTLTATDSVESKSFKVAVYNHDGSKLATGGDDGLAVLPLGEEGKLSSPSSFSLNDLSVLDVCFSPAGTYIAVLSPFHSERCPNNVKIFCLASGQAVYEGSQRNLQNWRPLWADDECYACVHKHNQLTFILQHESLAEDTDSSTEAKIHLQNLRSFSISPLSGEYIATFCGQVKQQPCSLNVYRKTGNIQSVIEHSIFQIDEVEFKWNQSGTSVLANCQDMRSTDKSYYGESKLFLINALTKVKTIVCYADDQLSLSVADFSWSPTTDEFCVVFDRSFAALFAGDGQRLKTFSCQYSARNGVTYHASGAFIALTGSGNVKGNFETWHRPSDAKPKLIKPVSGQVDVPYATMFRWSPKSAFYILAATTFPRLRQENGFRILDMIGRTLYSIQVHENNLCDVIWRPLSSRKESECCALFNFDQLLMELKAAKEQLKQTDEHILKQQRYVPPHIRNKQTGAETPCGPSDSPKITSPPSGSKAKKQRTPQSDRPKKTASSPLQNTNWRRDARDVVAKSEDVASIPPTNVEQEDIVRDASHSQNIQEDKNTTVHDNPDLPQDLEKCERLLQDLNLLQTKCEKSQTTTSLVITSSHGSMIRYNQMITAKDTTKETTDEPIHLKPRRPAIELGAVTTHNIKQLRVVNCFVFPVRYTDSFYTDIISEHGALSRLAYCNDIVVGGVCCRVEVNDGGHKMYIMTLGVLKTYRRLGIGGIMLDFVMNAAESDSSIECVYLHVQTTNQVAIDFYKRYGFDINGTVENYYHNLEDSSAYLVVKSLRDPADIADAAKTKKIPSPEKIGPLNPTQNKTHKSGGAGRTKRRH